MSDPSPFGDFSDSPPLDAFDTEQQAQGQEEDSNPIALGPPSGDLSNMQPQEGEEPDEEPMAMPPPSADAGLDPFEQEAAPQSDDELEVPAEAEQAEEQEQAPQGGDELADDPFATVDGGSSSNAGAFDSFSGAEVEVKEEEAAALAKWEKERAQVLRERADKAAADKQAAIDQAKEEISKFYADQQAALERQKKINRGDEKNYRTDMKTTFESGARWEKVGKLISTQPKANEKAGTARVERMRKLLIQLKQEKKA